VREAGRHVAIAWALTGLIRAVPFHARQRRLYLPQELLSRHGVDERLVFELKTSPGLAEAAAEVAGLAAGHLAKARAGRHTVPAQARPALLPASLAGLYLRVLKRAGYDVFAPRVQLAHPLRPAVLAWRAMTGRY
jgi:phytoene synthase